MSECKPKQADDNNRMKYGDNVALDEVLGTSTISWCYNAVLEERRESLWYGDAQIFQVLAPLG